MKYLFRIILFLFVSIGLVTCDDVDLSLDENQAEEVLGVWKERYLGNRNVFMLISNTEFNFYEIDSNFNCAKVEANQVIKRDGTGFFQVEKGDGSSPIVYAVTNNDGDLHLRAIDDSDEDIRYFWPSEVDVSTFSECLDETDIQGKWEFTQNDETTYVEITDDTLSVSSQFRFEDCFETVDYFIDGRTDNIYRLIDQISGDISAELFVEIKRAQEGLEITLEEDEGTVTDLYSKSTADLSTLGPDCGLNFPSEYEGIWEFEAVINTTESLLHMELRQDTLRYYTFIVNSNCTDINIHPVRARRGDSFFLSDINSETIDLFYRIFFDQDVLVTRISEAGTSFDERFLRSTFTIAELESNLCTTDF